MKCIPSGRLVTDRVGLIWVLVSGQLGNLCR